MSDVDVHTKPETTPARDLLNAQLNQERLEGDADVNTPARDSVLDLPGPEPLAEPTQNHTEPPGQDRSVSPLEDVNSPPAKPASAFTPSDVHGPFSDLEVNTQVNALSPPIPEPGPGPPSQTPDEAAQLEIPLASGLEIASQPPAPAPSSEPSKKIEETHKVEKVTPLHMLDKEPGYIDCPFCQKRSITRVTKVGTSMQTMAGVVLCLLCVCLTCLPCWAGWFVNIEHRCANCGKLVLRRSHEGPVDVFGPDSHPQSVPSKYPAAEKNK